MFCEIENIRPCNQMCPILCKNVSTGFHSKQAEAESTESRVHLIKHVESDEAPAGLE